MKKVTSTLAALFIVSTFGLSAGTADAADKVETQNYEASMHSKVETQ
ncbi:hypothetical protein [Shouchella miscanthi]|uniref:Uncharacterized protein n=1 Tax=Shouchella miscanthi TaxID=2598861 RepID=A0ABU6NQX7_9BACI|nr:hypothetical protein [Shouchella miscanthi]